MGAGLVLNLSARSCSLLMRSASSSCDDRVQARGRFSEATARSAEREREVGREGQGEGQGQGEGERQGEGQGEGEGGRKGGGWKAR